MEKEAISADLGAVVERRTAVTAAQIAEFCQRWGVVELALFGSVLRSDFRDDSDVDVLVAFAPERRLTWDEWTDMQAELEQLFQRKIDLTSKEYLRNPYRRHEILNSCWVVYAT